MKANPGSIVFINPPGPPKLYRSMVCTFVSKANYIWQPQDFINLSAQVPQDYKLDFIDCSLNNKTAEDLFAQIRHLKPGLAVIAISSIVFNQDLVFLKSFRSVFPGIKCLALGDVLLETTFWDKVLESADGLILNSLDVDLKRYIETTEAESPNLVLKSGRRPAPAKKECNQSGRRVMIGMPRHEIFINRKYRLPFIKTSPYSTVSTQFGCPLRCSYCSWSKIPVTYRDYGEVLDEIAKVKSLGINEIFFGDPSFGFPLKNAAGLLDGMISGRFNIKWLCYANPALLDREFLTKMEKAGCHTVIIGVEDADLDMLNRQYGRNLSRDKLVEFSKCCRGLDIQICGDFIIGLNSNETTVDKIITLAKELKLDYASFNIFTVLPGSVLREKWVMEKKIDPGAIGQDTTGTFGRRDERLIQLRDSAVKRFYLRPGYLLKRVSKIRNLAELMIKLKEMAALLNRVSFRR